MDLETEQIRARQRLSYRLCGIGFSVYGFAMLVSSLLSIGSLLYFFRGFGLRVDIGRLFQIEGFEFYHDTFRAATRIFSAICLLAAWSSPAWRKRAGLLTIMASVDVFLWATENGVRLGLLEEPAPHAMMRHSFSMAMSWAKLGLLGGLVASFGSHLDNEGLLKFARTTRTTASTGAILWFLFFLETTDWTRPWPMRMRPFNMELAMFNLLIQMVSTVCILQGSLIGLSAGRAARAEIRKMDSEDQMHIS